MKKIKKHNIERYGETYDSSFIDDQINELLLIKPWIVLSGGWAWHFISPIHIEYKHLHDHSDIDIFVLPKNFLIVQLKLEENEWHRMKTKYDNNNFIRYEKINERKMVIDMFKGNIPNVEVKGWNVVEPEYLLSLYKTVHQSDNCMAVQGAKQLKGVNIIDNELLISFPKK